MEEEKTKQSSICVHKYSAHAKEQQWQEETEEEEEELVKQGRQWKGSNKSFKKAKSKSFFNCEEMTRLLISPA